MSEDLAAEATPDEASAPEVPAITEDRIKALLAEADRKAEDRVKGIQSSLGKQITALRNENESLKRRVPSDPEDDRSSALDAERRRLERELTVAKLALANPRLAPLLTSLNEAEGPEGWVEALTSWQQASDPASPPASDPASEPEPTPPVDPNRNRREPSGWGPDGPTGDQAMEFLKNFKTWPTIGT